MKPILKLIACNVMAAAVILISCKKVPVTTAPAANQQPGGNQQPGTNPGTLCNEVSLAISSGTGTLTRFGSLSEANEVRAATSADKLLFVGGKSDNKSNVDIYNLTTQTWTRTTSNIPGYAVWPIVVGNKILLIDRWTNSFTTVVEMYDAVADKWSTTSLHLPYRFATASLGTVNGKAFFAGGLQGNSSSIYGNPTKRVDVYNVEANNWHIAELSQARGAISIASAGNKVLFAGGNNGYFDPDDTIVVHSSRVDIHDAVSNTWSTAELSEARVGMTTAAIGNKLFFVGGVTIDSNQRYKATNRVDIYDVSTNHWTTATLSEARSGSIAIAVGEKLLFAGGEKMPGLSDKVDIYDAPTNSWSVATLSQARIVSSTAVLENKSLLFTSTPWGPGYSNQMDIYDASANSWTSVQLNYPIGSQAITAGNQIFIGGGTVTGKPTCLVWTYQF